MTLRPRWSRAGGLPIEAESPRNEPPVRRGSAAHNTSRKEEGTAGMYRDSPLHRCYRSWPAAILLSVVTGAVPRRRRHKPGSAQPAHRGQPVGVGADDSGVSDRRATRAWRGRALHVDDHWRSTGNVVWNATGGTMASDGSYTAGVLSGTYLVTATLPGAAAASATVTISGPPVVSIAPGQNIQSVVDSQPPARRSCSRQAYTATRRSRLAPGTPSWARPAAAPGSRFSPVRAC